MSSAGSRPPMVAFPSVPPPMPILEKKRPASPKIIPVSPLADEDTFDDFLLLVESDGYDPSSIGLLEDDEEDTEKCRSSRSSFHSIPDLEKCSSRPITPPFINGSGEGDNDSTSLLPPIDESATRAVSPSSTPSRDGKSNDELKLYTPKYVERARKLAKAMKRAKHSRIQLLRMKEEAKKNASTSSKSSRDKVYHMSAKARKTYEASDHSRREIFLVIRPHAF